MIGLCIHSESCHERFMFAIDLSSGVINDSNNTYINNTMFINRPETNTKKFETKKKKKNLIDKTKFRGDVSLVLDTTRYFPFIHGRNESGCPRPSPVVVSCPSQRNFRTVETQQPYFRIFREHGGRTLHIKDDSPDHWNV